MPAPTVTAVKTATAKTLANSLNGGPPSGGYKAVITGTNLTGATAVKFGALTSPSFTVVSSTEIEATVPQAYTFSKGYTPGVVNVIVTTPEGSNTAAAENVFIYWPAPTIRTTSTGFTEMVPLGVVKGTGEEVVSYLKPGVETVNVPLSGDYSRASFVTINTVGTEITGTPKLIAELETSHDGGKTWVAAESAAVGGEVNTATETSKTTKVSEKPLGGLTRLGLKFAAAGGVAGLVSINARY